MSSPQIGPAVSAVLAVPHQGSVSDVKAVTLHRVCAPEWTSPHSSAVNYPERHCSLSGVTHVDTSSTVLWLPKPCWVGIAAFLL